jgi:hypothetical protein
MTRPEPIICETCGSEHVVVETREVRDVYGNVERVVAIKHHCPKWCGARAG